MVTANTLVQGSDTWVSGSSSVVTTMPVSSTAHIIAFIMDFWLTGRIETGAVPAFFDTSHSVTTDVGLFIVRAGFGGYLALNHGLGKLQSWPAKHDSFPDPLNVGHATSLALTIFGEFVCGLAPGIDRVELCSVYRARSAIEEADGDFLRLIRRLLRSGGQHEQIVGWSS